jgi:hypothetical protein
LVARVLEQNQTSGPTRNVLYCCRRETLQYFKGFASRKANYPKGSWAKGCSSCYDRIHP